MEPLHISNRGVFLGKHSERVVVRQGKETLEERPFLDLEQVLVTGRGVSLSSDLIEECGARGIPITFLTPWGKPYARIAATELNATVRTRREQMAAGRDDRGARLMRAMIAGKLRNQANLLRAFGKYHKVRRPDLHAQLYGAATTLLRLRDEALALPGDTPDALRPSLFNREGRGAALYWSGVAALLGDKAEFLGREHRGAQDPVNAAFNYGYGILQSQVWTAATLAGLEPFGGFLHVDRPGKPSLILDLMEEFRQPGVDRPLLAAWGRGWTLEMEPAEGDEERVWLTKASRDVVAQRVLERLEAPTPYAGKRCALKNVIQAQARRLAVAVRGEAEYVAYTSNW